MFNQLEQLIDDTENCNITISQKKEYTKVEKIFPEAMIKVEFPMTKIDKGLCRELGRIIHRIKYYRVLYRFTTKRAVRIPIAKKYPKNAQV